ncbi:TonB family protein [Alteromonas pelagimontana]|uniref:Protein TonB n=1 Tax=Alteromonas pelagimontana TaxID=1858656 RepID=A0A6M4MDR2_9ALTE|nr:TonB family protein [Alteromonas pelagimontana]QJR80286.1 TonB family protein [Alteromonas pelagimontana]
MRPSLISFCVVMAASSFTLLADAKEDTFSDVYHAYESSLGQDDTDARETLAKKALALGQVKFGKDSENTANLTYNYANALTANKKYEQATEVFEQVAEQYEDLYGYESPELFTFYVDTILALQEAPSQPQADYSKLRQKFLKRVIMDTDDVLEEHQDPDLAARLYYQGSRALSREGNLPVYASTASQFMEQAVKHVEDIAGTFAVRTLEVKFIQGAVLAVSRNRYAAIERYEEVAQAFDNNVSFSHPYALASHAKLVNLYEQEGESEKATQHCVAIGKMTPWEENQEPTPLYRKNPVYPQHALRHSISGYVRLKFNIDEQGFVRNPEVLEAEGASQFKNASLQALEQWRYAPKFENGKPVPAEDNVVQLDFKVSYH